MTHRAIILARGLGTRMRREDTAAVLNPEQQALADQGIKAMVPTGAAGRPFLDYVLAGLADAGIRNVCLVVGPEHGPIRNYYMEKAVPRRLRIEFAIQENPKGTADALLAARAFATADAGPFLVLNSDNYYPAESVRVLVQYAGPALPGFDRTALVRLGNIGQERIRRFALLRVDGDGFLLDIVEKPDEQTFARMGEHALVSMNLWSFSPVIFDACERVTPSSRGELELPAAVRFAVRQMGERLRVFPLALGVLDLSQRADIAAVASGLPAVAVDL